MSWKKHGLNSSYILIATLGRAIMQWAIMLFVGHIDGPALVGEYALAQAYVTPAAYLAWLSIRQQYLVSRQDGASLADFLFLRTVCPLLVFCFLLINMFFFYSSRSFFWVVAGYSTLIYIDGFFDLANGKMQRTGDIAGVAQTNFVRSVISIPFFGVFYVSTRSLSLSFFALAALWTVIFLLERRRLALSVEASELFDMTIQRLRHRGAIAYDLVPVGMTHLIMLVGTYAPRYLIGAVLGPKELGFFSAASQFLTIGSIVAISIGQALLPSLANACSKGLSRTFWRHLLWPVFLIQCASTFGIFIAVIWGSDLLRLFYGPPFASQGHMLVAATIVAGPVYGASIISNGIFAAQMRKAFFAIQCLSTSAVVVATFLLIPHFATDGAFAAMMTSAITQASISILLLLRFFAKGPIAIRA